MLMDQVDTLHVSRYWSEILCFYDPPEQTRSRSWVIDFDKFSGKAQVRRATLSCDSSFLANGAIKIKHWELDFGSAVAQEV